MDKHRPNKISKSFEEQHDEAFFDAQLPDLWGAISNELDQATPAEGHTIKESFETQHDDQTIEEALPTLLWSNIAEQLDRPEGHIVKESFEALDSPEPSNAIWQAVETQLEIESVWKNIRNILDQRTRLRYWRDKLIQVSLVALALLWIRGCYPDYPPIEPTEPVATTTPKPLAAAQPTSPSQHTGTTALKDQLGTTKHHPEPTAPAISQPTVANTTATASNDPTLAQAQPATSNQEPSNNALRSTNAPATTGTQPALPNTMATAAATPNHFVENTVATTSATDATTRTVKEPSPTASESAQRRPTMTQLLAAIPMATPTPWEPQLITAPQERIPVEGPLLTGAEPTTPLENGLVEPVIEQLAARHHHTPIHRWEVGLETRLSNSLLWGEATTKAMEATSMTSTQMQTLASVGMVVAWHWSHRDALLLTAHPAVNSQQHFGGYTNEGRYYWQQIRLTRAEGTFSYQRTLWRGNFWHGQTSRLYARALYHFSHLTKGEEYINDELIETTSTYQRWQHSAGLALGISQQIHRWAIDLGAQSTCGLSTMSQGGNAWSDSRLVTWGAYVGLRYRL